MRLALGEKQTGCSPLSSESEAVSGGFRRASSLRLTISSLRHRSLQSSSKALILSKSSFICLRRILILCLTQALVTRSSSICSGLIRVAGGIDGIKAGTGQYLYRRNMPSSDQDIFYCWDRFNDLFETEFFYLCEVLTNDERRRRLYKLQNSSVSLCPVGETTIESVSSRIATARFREY